MARYHVFMVQSQEKNPETGEIWLDENKIKRGVSHKTITKWAYICHDKDVYTLEEEEEDKTHVAGTVKPIHWHVMCFCHNAVSVDQIASFFKIKSNFVEVFHGRSAFIDGCQYLTHEGARQQALGKRLYHDDEVMCSPGFNFRAEIDEYQQNCMKYGGDVSKKVKLENAVLYDGMTLLQVIREDKMVYQEDMEKLKKYRLEYIEKIQPMPSFRLNIYIEGGGRTGKGLFSRALARFYADPRNECVDDDEIYFETSLSGKVLLDGYDGQPVVIWNEGRASTLKRNLGGISAVLDIFDTAPTNKSQNVKYGHVKLKNTFNIVNSTQKWEDWVHELCGYERDELSGTESFKEDPAQIYGRFPIFMIINENNFTVRYSKGFFEGTREFEQIKELGTFKGNFRKLIEECGNEHNEAYRAVSKNLIENSVGDKLLDAANILSHNQKKTDAEIWDEFCDPADNPFAQVSFLNPSDVAILQELGDNEESPFEVVNDDDD